MQIKDLIVQLQALYNTYDAEYKSIAGEPEIMIDVFRGANPQLWQYAGISGNIVIDKSGDGIYDIISAFHEDYTQNQEAEEPTSGSLSWPEIWST